MFLLGFELIQFFLFDVILIILILFLLIFFTIEESKYTLNIIRKYSFLINILAELKTLLF